MAQLDGKVALITGGARGQGAAEARRFVAEGARVVVGDVAHDEGKALASELGSAAAYVGLDVTDESDWAEAISAAGDLFGPIDVLVNNAGIVRVAPLVQTATDDYMAVVRVNQLGVFLGMRAVLPGMIERRSGAIVNISSIDGIVGMPGMSAYAATKHAVIGMTKSVALEVAAFGVRVNAVLPGGVDTPMLDMPELGFDIGAVVASKVPMARLADAGEVAGLVCYLASEESRYCTGSSFVIDGGMTAGIPLA